MTNNRLKTFKYRWQIVVGILFVSIFNSLILSAQEAPFTFEKKGLFKSKTVIKNCGFELTQTQLVTFMADDPLMNTYSGKLAGLFLTKTIVSTTGSILSTWPLLQLQLDQEPNLNLTYAGLGTLAISMILDKAFMNKAVKAANFYNNGYHEPDAQVRILLRPASSGIGLALVF